MASNARALALADSRLAINDVARKLNRATQFCGSAMVKVPTGGKKKKLKTSVARIEDSAASTNPQVLAMIKTTSRYANPTVVAFTGTMLRATTVTVTTAIKDANTRNQLRPNLFPPPAILGHYFSIGTFPSGQAVLQLLRNLYESFSKFS
jgi:hypothetical protein